MKVTDLPPDFDPQVYLSLHADVAAANVDPVHHYLNHGRHEGRLYKVLKPDDTARIEFMRTIVLTKSELFRERLGKETLLVTGAARGATSLVAYTFLRLGYPLVADTPSNNHEIQEMMDAIRDPEKREAVINRENARHARWGFKLPAAATTLNWYLARLRSPIIVMVVRNPLATAQSVIRREPTWGKGETGLLNALRHAERHVSAACAAITCPAPVVLVNVDHAQRNPDAFVRELADLFDLTFDDEIANEISVPGYKATPKA